MIINIEKRYAFIIFGLLISAIGIFLIYALAPSIDTSQGYHESNQVSVSVSGTEKTLQEAIDDGSFGGGIASGFCIFSRTQTSCPSGWTRDAGFDGRTISGSATPGGIGGSDSHSHTGPSHTHSMSYSSYPSENWLTAHNIGWSTGYYGDTRPKAGTIQSGLDSTTAYILEDLRNTLASGTGATSSTSSWPPYMDVIVCCKD